MNRNQRRASRNNGEKLRSLNVERHEGNRTSRFIFHRPRAPFGVAYIDGGSKLNLMSMMDRLKSRVRRTLLYRPLVKRKAKKQEKEYLMLREYYYTQKPTFFASPGYMQSSLELLQNRWRGPKEKKGKPSEVRLFVVDIPAIGGPWFESELDRTFDTSLFSISRHLRGFNEGKGDLLSYSMGIHLEDRTLPYPIAISHNSWKAKLQNDLVAAFLKAHEEHPIDLCFVYATSDQVDPQTLVRIKKVGAPVVLMSLDDKHGYSSIKPLIGSYDLHLTNSLESVRWYFSEGVPAIHFPQGIDSELYRPLGLERDIPVSFVGLAYGVRFDFIRDLRKSGVQVECFGPGWRNGIHPNQIEVFCRSRINLGIGFTGLSSNTTCVKGRDFEVPATGSFYLTTYNHELTNLFDIGHEIVCYRDPMDCVELIRYFLERPDEAATIGAKARKRCLKEHTWSQRLIGVLKFMGILMD